MRVLLGIEGTDESLAALETTVQRAIEAGDDLTVAILDEADANRSPATTERAVEGILDDHDFDAEIAHVEGDPGSRLLELAEGERYDRLVISGGSESPMGKIQLGPITEFVLLNSQTTVTLVR